jgi:hypothetical protein
MTTQADDFAEAANDATLEHSAKWLSAIIALCIAIYVAGIKPIGISADLLNYELLYASSAVSDWPSILKGGDVGYFAAAKLAASSGLSFNVFTFALALVTCIFLFFVAKSIKVNRLVLVAIYGSYLFWLHEYTQIRVAAAIAIGLYAIYSAPKSVRWPLFVVSVLLHNSFIVVVGAYGLIKTRRVDVLLGLAVCGLIVWMSPFSEGLLSRIIAYQDLASSTGQFSEINIFSSMPILQILGLGCAALSFFKLPGQGKEEMAFSALGVAAFYAAASVPVLAFRTFEVFMPFFVVLLARLWTISTISRFITLAWMLVGLRSAFFTPDSVVILR